MGKKLADSLLTLYGDNPFVRTPFALQREIESNRLDKNEIIDFIASDLAEHDSITELITFLFGQDEKIYKMQAVGTALEIDSLDLVRDMLAEINFVTTEDGFWGDIIHIVLSLKDSGKTVFSMDSTMIADVKDIANSGIECLGTRNAQSILKLVYGVDFTEGEIETVRLSNISSPQQTKSQTVKYKDFYVYPNPANTSLTLSYNSMKKDSKIEIFDITGKLIKLVMIKSDLISLEINTEDLCNGIYQLIYITENEYITNKFIIQH